MKTKKFFISVMLVLIATFYLPPAFAQDLYLPEGARARIGGKFGCSVLEAGRPPFEAGRPLVVHLWDFDYLPDGRRLIVADSAAPWLYDANTGQQLGPGEGYANQQLWQYQFGTGVRGTAVSPDGKLVFGHLSGMINLLMVEDGASVSWAPLRYLSRYNGIAEPGEDMQPVYVPIAWHESGDNTLVTVVEKGNATGSFSSFIHMSNSKGTVRRMIHEHKPVSTPHHPRVEYVGFHAGRVASISLDGIIHTWDRSRGLPWQTFMWYRPREIQDGKGGLRVILGMELGGSDSPGFWWTGSPKNSPFALTVGKAGSIVEAVVNMQSENRFGIGRGVDTANQYALPLDSLRYPANTMSLFDYGIDRVTQTLVGHTGCIWNVVYSEDGEWIASASVDDTIRVWNPQNGNEVMRFENHTLHFSNLAFSSDGKTLAIGQWDGGITFCNLENVGGAVRWYTHKWHSLHTGPVTSVAFHPKLPILASASADGTLGVWSLDTNFPFQRSQIKHDLLYRNVPLTGVAFSPDGRKLAVGKWARSPGTTVVVLEWNGVPRVGEPLGVVYEDEIELQLDRHWESVTSVAFSPDGELLAAGGVEGAINLWAINAEGNIQSIPHVLPRHKDSVFKVAFSPDGKTLASGSDDGTILLWDRESVAPFDHTDPPKPEDENGNGDEASPPPEDVNGDGEVNILDLVVVSANFGQTGKNVADVNQNGVVDIQDLVLVAGALDNAAAAPSTWNRDLEFPLIRMEVAQWLTQAQQLNLTESTSQRGIRFLEALLASLTPQETALLANYPNPFNPETWIPYQLAVPADVTLRIYAMDGSLIRTLVLGYQAAGIYQSRGRAAYWDGKNEVGEPVASGTYFYTLTAGEFSSTRKLLIRK